MRFQMLVGSLVLAAGPLAMAEGSSTPRPGLLLVTALEKDGKWAPSPPVAPEPGLELEKDPPPEGTLHKAQLNKVIFSKQPILADSPDALPLADTFTLADTIYPYSYVERSFRNDWNSVGMKCFQAQRVGFAVRIDATNDFIPLSSQQNDGRQTAIRPNNTKRQLTQVPIDDEENATSDAFTLSVLPRLVEGSNKLTFVVYGECDGNKGKFFMVHSQGEMTLNIAKGDREKYWATFGPFVPKSQHPQAAKLAADLKKLVTTQWPNEEVIHVTIPSEDWTLERNDLTGRIVKRSVEGAVVARLKSEPNKELCRMFMIGLEQEAKNNAGTSFGASAWGGNGGATDIPCSNAKKTK
ncbi:MAG: hypothetical protein SFX73_28455 [Kofleriaceae bacterium]|nr:hypothetical protein [Kofleriaceae bacterium]